MHSRLRKTRRVALAGLAAGCLTLATASAAGAIGIRPVDPLSAPVSIASPPRPNPPPPAAQPAPPPAQNPPGTVTRVWNAVGDAVNDVLQMLAPPAPAPAPRP